MSGDRTEAPTPRRLREARRRGEVATSRELTAAAALAGGLAGLVATGPALAHDLARLLRDALARAPALGDALAPSLATGRASTALPSGPEGALTAAAGELLRLALAPALAALACAGLAGSLQAGFLFRAAPLAPRLERLHPGRGLRRLFAPAQLSAAGLGLAKAAALLALAWAWLRDAGPSLLALPGQRPEAGLRLVPSLLGLATRLAAALLAFGALDHLLARRRRHRALRMTRDEVRRERRDDEGDPALRAERRRLGRALTEAGPVARATVLVVNPTRVAVALRHERGGDDAPRVVAKGTGRAALRLRSAARRAGVPIVEDVPLARALHARTEPGDEIPEELYEAAAAVLAHLYAREDVR